MKPLKQRVVAAVAALALTSGLLGQASPASAVSGVIVYGWGLNGSGQVGNGGIGPPLPTPAPVSGLATDVTQVSGSGGVSAARHSDGSVWTWGSDRRLGYPSPSRSTPARVPGLPWISQVSAGTGHVLTVDGQGKVWGWGDNFFGELGVTGPATSVTPVGAPISTVVQVAAGRDFSLALKSNGEVFAWGGNGLGQLGNGTVNAGGPTPVRVAVPYGIVQIAAWGNFGVALRNDGSVWTWGRNTNGQLGNGTTANAVPTPVRVDRRVSGIVQIGAGDNHAMALGGDGTVWIWGANDHGQIGDGTKADRLVPVHLGLTGITKINAGRVGSMALDSGGNLSYWGSNTSGEAANGTVDITDANPITQPTRITTLPGVVTMSVGEYTPLAIATSQHAVVPHVIGVSCPVAAAALSAADLTPACSYNGGTVTAQSIPSGTVVPKFTVVGLSMRAVVPDVTDLSCTGASNQVRAAGLVPQCTGTGTWVGSQSPAAGRVVDAGTTVTLSMRSGPRP
ncbi:PASTA domain-containing protein [Nonomuraea sp. MTCD27]|uniref:RCC1 domain-containing protein n=1 Tax=Nonomuraea sp. MTCD27 TaxID=1676747 RepID=UPI0035BFCC93